MFESENQTSLAADQQVLGYVLRKRIGSGGYGEVWSAEAPGGILKAVKFIYGFHDEKRAMRELKALDRIKHIRHPFLLSLERIDIVDGRMVVITELAEMCLKTRFNLCREQGLLAIPREELLQYLRETADALDYIAEHHDLVHLDIKPENLLLVGGHAKVADFGLVKDLHSVTQSLMDGLTPTYAAPELFDGRPCRASDQYSLAIVYQELLTATRPFSGTTAAQLANQHLHSWPNLNALPRSEQAVIARALAKEPDQRYPDCQSMVAELVKRRSRASKPGSDVDPSRLESVSTGQQTSSVNIERVNSDAQFTERAVPLDAEVKKQPPLQLDESRACIRPTLFIGVGNTGIQVLAQLRQKLASRFGPAEQIPAFRFLCMDADRRTLFDSTAGNEPGTIQSHELVNIPLRRPEDYRNDVKTKLDWIGRRWIYNIPKSQLTESLRPLGRLAFVDNHDTVFRRLSDELAHLARAEHLATTAENMRLLPSNQPAQVFVISSVSGGLGSGMLSDLAFSIRTAMGELGLSDGHVFGIATHSTSRHVDARLSTANSYCFLRELFHYNLNGYPGCESCGIPEFENSMPTFDRTWFLHLGDDLSQTAWRRVIDGLAEYLFLATASRCTSFFSAFREHDECEPGSLQTMGIGYFGQGQPPLSRMPSIALANDYLKSWTESTERAGLQNRYRPRADKILAKTNLESGRLDSRIRLILNDHFGGEPTKHLMKRLREVLASPVHDGDPGALGAAISLLNDMLGNSDEPQAKSQKKQRQSASDACNDRLSEIAQGNRDELTATILGQIDDSHQRLHGAIQLTGEMLELLQLIAVSLESTCDRLEQTIAGFPAQYEEVLANQNQADRPAACWAFLAELVDARVSQLIETCKLQQVHLARIDLAEVLEQLNEHGRTIASVREKISLPVSNGRGKVANDLPDAAIYRLMVEHATELAESLLPDLDERFTAEFLQPQGGLHAILAQPDAWIRQLPTLVIDVAQKVVNRALQETNIDAILGQAKIDVKQLDICLESLVQAATPRLANCGGSRRILIAVPQRAPLTAMAGFIQRQLEQEPNIIPSTCGELAVCIELDEVPGEHIALKLLQLQPGCTELIKRLSSRNDIQWSALTTLG